MHGQLPRLPFRANREVKCRVFLFWKPLLRSENIVAIHLLQNYGLALVFGISFEFLSLAIIIAAKHSWLWRRFHIVYIYLCLRELCWNQYLWPPMAMCRLKICTDSQSFILIYLRNYLRLSGNQASDVRRTPALHSTSLVEW